MFFHTFNNSLIFKQALCLSTMNKKVSMFRKLRF